MIPARPLVELQRLARRVLGGSHAKAWVVAVALLLGLLAPFVATGYLSTGPTSDRIWFWQNPLPQGNDLRATSWPTNSVGYAVGVTGTMLKSVDGGATWVSLDPGTTRDLTGVSFVDATHGWAVGVSGTVIYTSNGGLTWTPQTALTNPAARNFRAVSFSDSTHGIAVGDQGTTTATIVYTSDGGVTWKQSRTVAAVGLSGVWMTSPSNGWAVGGGGTLLQTTNGGLDWTAKASGTTAGLSAIAFSSDGQVGYFVGNAVLPNWTIYRTTNGGTSWAAVSGLGATGAVNLTAVSVFGANEAIAVGTNGQIRHTRNGGATWLNQSQNNVGGVALRDVRIIDASNSKIVGDYGYICYTTSGGDMFFDTDNWTSSVLYASSFVDAIHGWAVGANGNIMMTADAGQTWQQQAAGIGNWRDVYFRDGTHGWTVGDSGQIMRTTDGVNWQYVTSGTTQQLNGVWFTSLTTGVAVGTNGTLIKTTDGGVTWQGKPSGTGVTLNGVWFADANTGYVVGNSGHVEKSVNGGETWANSISGGQTLLSVSGASTSTVWVSGNNGTVLKTTNGGTAWNSQTSGAGSQPVRSIRFANANTGWLVSTYGRVAVTTNGGTTWTTQSAGIPTSVSDPVVGLWGLSAVDANTAYIVGDGGLIHRTTNGGAAWQSLQYGTKSNLQAMAIPDSTNGWVVGAGGTVMHSSDGGQVWSRQRTGTTSGFNSITMLDGSRGWAAGDAGALRYTVNGGYTWAAQASGVTTNLAEVASADGTAAIIAGGGALKYTTNSGSSWTTATTRPTQPVTAVYMTDATHAWAVTSRVSGTSGIWLTTGGGANWSAQSTTATVSLWDVYFLNKFSLPNTGFAVGDSGVVLKTVDGGVNWVRQPTPTTLPLYAVRFTDADHGVAVGGAGLVLRTSDRGATWTVRSSGSGVTLNAVGAFGAGREWTAGTSSALLRMSDLIPPITTLTMSPASYNGANGWYKTMPTLSLASTTSPVTTYYNWASPAGPYTQYLGAFSALEGSQTLYYYSVDNLSNAESPKAASILVDTIAPTAPTGIQASSVASSTAWITWNAASDASSGIDHYNVTVGSVAGTFTASTASTAVWATALTPATLYNVTVVAVDVAGNLSTIGGGPAFTTNTVDMTPLVTQLILDPPMPNALGWYVTTPTIVMTTTPTGIAGVTRYNWISPDGPWIDWTQYALPGGQPSPDPGVHTLYFSTHSDGRLDEPTQTATFKVDTTAPATPSVTATATSYSSIVATWPAVLDPPSGIAYYDVYLGVALNSRVTSTGVDIVGLKASTLYSVKVVAVSGAGTPSPTSTVVTATTDIAPVPDPPSDVFVKAPSGNYAFINWTPVTISDGAVSYRIYRSEDGWVTWSAIATTTGGIDGYTYIDTGLTSSKRYWYGVTTVDARGESSMGGTATTQLQSTSPTTGPPARPEGFTATKTETAVTLRWNGSANPGVAGYYVKRAQSSLAATSTTLTVSPTLFTSYVDSSANPGEPYYYFVVAVDQAGTIGFPSLEAEGRSVAAIIGRESQPHMVGTPQSACMCHSAHIAAGTGQLQKYPGDRPADTCELCHAPATSLGEFLDPLAKSRHSLSTTMSADNPFTCLTCHVPVYNSGETTANLLRVNGSWVCTEVTGVPAGNGFCYQCHGVGSTLPQGDLTAFELSGHNNIPAPPTGAGLVCDACHESHSSRNEHLNTYSGFMMCVQCHTSAASNPNEPDIWTKLQLNQEANAKHPLLPSDQTTGARMMCQNCHNTHLSTTTYPLVDPHNPSPSGLWTGSRSDQKQFCFRCHNGQPLPTSAETTSWAEAVYAENTSTIVTDIQTAYQRNIHGYGVKSNTATTTLYLRSDMGYTANMVLECRSCHDPHGTMNNYALQQNVVSASGNKTVSGLAVEKVAGGGYDLRFFCRSCHLWDQVSHATLANTSTVDWDLPVDCTQCHRHVRLSDGLGSRDF